MSRRDRVAGIERCDRRFDLNSLLALLLIILQFGRKDHHDRDDEDQILDDSILFVIALFLCLCGCRSFFGGLGCGCGD